MPIIPGGISVGGRGGGGLHFRQPVDVFASTAARSTYFTTTDADAYEEFVQDRSLAIIIGTLASGTFWTYTGAVGTYDDALWAQRTDAVQSVTPGPKGDDGDDAQVSATNVNPIIAAYTGSIAGLDIAEGQIPATITRDTELAAETTARTMAVAALSQRIDNIVTPDAGVTSQTITIPASRTLTMGTAPFRVGPSVASDQLLFPLLLRVTKPAGVAATGTMGLVAFWSVDGSPPVSRIGSSANFFLAPSSERNFQPSIIEQGQSLWLASANNRGRDLGNMGAQDQDVNVILIYRLEG